MSKLWTNTQYPNYTMEIVRPKLFSRLFAIKSTYPSGYSGILSMEDKPRWYLIDLLIDCGWRLNK